MSILQTYKRFVLPVFLPALLFQGCLQASLILLPLYVIEGGYGTAVAALAVSIRGGGSLVADIPIGYIVSRIGYKNGMLIGTAGNALSLMIFAVSGHPVVLSIGSIVSGIAFSSWLVSRLAYVTENCQAHERGRILAFTASTQRIAGMVGPVAGGFLATLMGYQFTFSVLGFIAAVATVLIIVFAKCTDDGSFIDSHSLKFVQILRTNKSVFLTAGTGIVGLLILRGSKPLIIPLLGHAIGLSAIEIGGIVSFSMIVDFIMFVPAGIVMDRWGRKATAIPGTFLLAIGLVTLALAGTAGVFIVGTMVMAIGNGLATGVAMTVSSDFAPKQNRSQFLGVWRFVCDLGSAGGPMLFTLLISLFSVAASSFILGGIASCCAVVMWRFAPEGMRNDAC